MDDRRTRREQLGERDVIDGTDIVQDRDPSVGERFSVATTSIPRSATPASTAAMSFSPHERTHAPQPQQTLCRSPAGRLRDLEATNSAWQARAA